MTADEYAPRPDSDLQGAWDGKLKAGNIELDLTLKIAEPAPGVFRAQMDDLDQGSKNVPITSLTFHKPAVRFEMTALNCVYEGNLNNRDDQMTGTLTQAGRKFPLTFQRTKGNAQAAVDGEKDYGQGARYQVQGHWKGALEANHTTLHIVLHIGLRPDGTYAATMDSPDQGASGIPATSAEFTYPNVQLEWQAIGATFTGKLENKKLSGTWHQGKGNLPLNLERSATP